MPYYRDTYKPMFIAAPFTAVRKQNQPRQLPTNEWIRYIWHIYTMEYYSEKKEIMKFTGKYIRSQCVSENAFGNPLVSKIISKYNYF